MNDKKRDMIPVAAIAVFLVIIIILCVVRLNARKKTEPENEGTMTQTVETMTAGEHAKETESETSDADEKKGFSLFGKKEAEEETKPEQDPLSDGKDKTEPEKKTGSGRTISGNDPFAGADSVNKSNEQMLLEMYAYWEEDNLKAVRDLADLGWYRKMSAGIADENTFYYYGERNEQGQPEGMGIACYADNEYYYGQWALGKREGNGEWIKFYTYYDDDTASDRAYQIHMYRGEWANDLPNGEGQEHYDLDMGKAAKSGRYVQNVIGSFADGLYSGEMYLTTIDATNNQEEWNGLAEEGIWSPYGAASNKKEVPICRDVDDEDNYLWLEVRSNKDRGIKELIP